jgi:hypothetical protein
LLYDSQSLNGYPAYSGPAFAEFAPKMSKRCASVVGAGLLAEAFFCRRPPAPWVLSHLRCAQLPFLSNECSASLYAGRPGSPMSMNGRVMYKPASPRLIKVKHDPSRSAMDGVLWMPCPLPAW